MEKIYPKNMNLPPHPLEHVTFILVVFVNWVCMKLVTFSSLTELVDLFFVIPLKVLPFVTAYVAYRKHWHETAKDVNRWFKKKFNGK